MSSLQQMTSAKHFKRNVIIAFFAVSTMIWVGYWIYNQFYLSTDDAYVNANVVRIAPRVTGKVSHLYVTNNQYVTKGQPLFALDSIPFQVAVDSALAQLRLSIAELDNATSTQKRTMALVRKHYVSPQDGDNTIANYKIAAAKVEQAKAALAQANLNLEYTKVTAPTSGWVTNVTLRVGDIIPANQPLFALISDGEFWVDANFKETEMAGIKSGQIASIETDLYPGHKFKGTVESISGGAGSAFSLLPPQNATGNWVKVTQRVPVRVRILNPDAQHPLRIGISSTVTIHLKSNPVENS